MDIFVIFDKGEERATKGKLQTCQYIALLSYNLLSFDYTQDKLRFKLKRVHKKSLSKNLLRPFLYF